MSHNPSLDAAKVGTEPVWRFAVRYRQSILDAEAQALKANAKDLGGEGIEEIRIASIYYLRGPLEAQQLKVLGEELLTDPITQVYEVQPLGTSSKGTPYESAGESRVSPSGTSPIAIEVAYRPGVMDPVEGSLKKGAQDLGVINIQRVYTAKEYSFTGSLEAEDLQRICEKLLVNPTIQQIVTPESLKSLLSPMEVLPLPIETVHLKSASDTVLQRVSLDHQLSLNLEEMRAIQAYVRKLDREPTLIELETLAQTWSEHCKHKTFRGDIVYTEEVDGKTAKQVIHDLLKSTIMRATEELDRPWVLSAFQDNSGVIAFDREFGVAFKVETHNHPSALEPFGGASTGVGGVIRDILGTGLGAKPIASTDVFCFAPPDFPLSKVPPGVLQPRRVIKGVVAGVKDYGNKMGIPTVNGAVLFDERFLGNPLVYCGNIGLIPRKKIIKSVKPGMAILLIGGRTGRDGIHGATFSSIALTAESETVSATAVQIGDPITEKKLADALLEARDQGLFSAVTDCGAGGLSSAIGEMGAHCGVRVHLDRVPLKYRGLTPTEIWISESQERMVLAVKPKKVNELIGLFARHEVEATPVGEFTDTGKLELFFQGNLVGELEMDFLHHGVPLVPRPARWVAPRTSEPQLACPTDLRAFLLKLLGRWDTCSKEWIIRQYDHEVQGGSTLKPLIGLRHHGPSDAAIVRPRLESSRGLAIGNGINFRYGDLDPYWMAVACVEEALRQIVAVGGSLKYLAILDNFCWGDPTRAEVLGGLVRAALGCYDAAKAFQVPFISGKDSLHNEYRVPARPGSSNEAGVGEKIIQIPGTLLISAIGVIPDVAKAVSMDAKRAGNLLYIVGLTKPELGGSAYYALLKSLGAAVPKVDLRRSPQLLKAVNQAIEKGLAVSAHDCSEGGLAVACAEMAFAGGLGLTLDLKAVPVASGMEREDWILFSESTTRFLLEVTAEKKEAFEKVFKGLPCGRMGEFGPKPIFQVKGLRGSNVLQTTLQDLESAWDGPFQGW